MYLKQATKVPLVWNVEQVLKYIDSGNENDTFGSKDITVKTGNLVALCSI